MGGLGTQVGLTALLYGHVGWPLWLSAAIAIQVAIGVNFSGNSLVTWRDRTGARVQPGRFAAFEAVSLVGLGVNEGVLLVLAAVLGIHYLIATLCGAVSASVWNYTANSRFTFGVDAKGARREGADDLRPDVRAVESAVADGSRVG